MAVQNIPQRVFKQIVDNELARSYSFFRDLQIGQFYIVMSDVRSFEIGRDVDIYKIVSDTQADVYKANKYNYKSVSNAAPSPERPSSQKNDSLYQSVTIDGQAISRIICNNQVIWSQSAEPQEVYNITAYVDANVSKLNDYAVIDYNQDFATYGVVWHRVDKVAVEVDGKIVAKLQKPVRTVAGGGAMLSIETWTYPFDGIDKYKNPTFKISQH